MVAESLLVDLISLLDEEKKQIWITVMNEIDNTHSVLRQPIAQVRCHTISYYIGSCEAVSKFIDNKSDAVLHKVFVK